MNTKTVSMFESQTTIPVNGSRLKELRSFRHLSVSELAKKSEVKRCVIENCESASLMRSISIGELMRINKILDFPLDYYITFSLTEVFTISWFDCSI